jgi:heme exporter protein D
MSGVLQGGWEFVWAAYALSAIVLGAYAASLVLRHRAELLRRAREAAPTTSHTP